jgi:thiol-disulfide isomerase/thioredoxin
MRRKAAADPPAIPPPLAPAGDAPDPVPPDKLGAQARWLVAAVAVAAAAVLFWPHGEAAEAPGGFLLDGDGRPQPLAARMAPVTLVHFWATWCPPCITEIPALERLWTDLGDRPDFEVVMIAVDDTNEKVEPFVGHRAAMMLYDPAWEVAHRYGTRKLPETYLVVGGRVVERWIGAQNWDEPRIRRQIDAHLAS